MKLWSTSSSRKPPHSGILLALILIQKQQLVFEKATHDFDSGTLWDPVHSTDSCHPSFWRSGHTLRHCQTPRKKEIVHSMVTVSRIHIKSLFTLFSIGEITSFSRYRELHFLPESSCCLMFSFPCFSISHSISNIYVAILKNTMAKTKLLKRAFIWGWWFLRHRSPFWWRGIATSHRHGGRARKLKEHILTMNMKQRVNRKWCKAMNG